MGRAHYIGTRIFSSLGFTDIFDTALKAYTRISRKTGVQTHQQEDLCSYLKDVKLDFSHFMNSSHAGSQRSSASESMTRHRLEHLADGDKAMFHIENYLGGIYYLTADEAFLEGDTYIIQESKNSTEGTLPSIGDIRDGLFKLILFANLGWLSLDGKKIKSSPRLKLTGKKVVGGIRLPSSQSELDRFLSANQKNFSPRQKKILVCLSKEAQENPNLTIEIASNR